jgi:hypothetical protein
MARLRQVPFITAALVLCLISCHKPPPEPVASAQAAEAKQGTTLTADPDPILVTDGTFGETTITWSTTAAHTEVHIGAPDGKLFVRGGNAGFAKTGNWVNDGLTFYLQDTDNPNPASADATLAKLRMVVQ